MSRSRRRLLLAGLGVAAGVLAAILLTVVFAPSPGVITHGPRNRPWIGLTFDADMTPTMLVRLHSGEVSTWYDPEIVSELRQTRTPATIFLTALWAETYPGVVRSLARDSIFELENHSVDHAAFERPCYGLEVTATATQKRWEIARAAEVITQLTGAAPRYFRFPGGCHDSGDVRLVRALGERPLQWDVVSGDAFQANAAIVVNDVLRGVRPGSIIVMHLNGAPNAPATASALRRLIPTLRERGFRFVTLRELLGSGSASAAAAPPFRGSVASIDDGRRARMTSWRPGCPVPIDDLRLLQVSYWGFDGAMHEGQLIVHRDYAEAVLGVFHTLFQERFPIDRMEPVDDFGGNDDRSMAADNTSGFNCRSVGERRGVWSEHAYGRAIDINPIENPYVASNGQVSPPAGRAYVDRSRTAPGMIHAGDATVQAFATIGWGWGGGWRFTKDYQHFSATGR